MTALTSLRHASYRSCRSAPPLAPSPNLHYIIVSTCSWDGGGLMNYNEEAAICLAPPEAQNLRSVHLVDSLPGAFPGLVRALRRGMPPPWKGFFLDRSLIHTPGDTCGS